jgi:hypothetical protein
MAANHTGSRWFPPWQWPGGGAAEPVCRSSMKNVTMAFDYFDFDGTVD